MSTHQNPSNDTPRVALLGMGHWGKNLARNLAQLGALHAVVDPVDESRAKVQEQWPDTQVFSEPEPVFEDEAVQGVVIAAPAVLHAPLALKAIAAGKDVFVEKPLALTSADGARMVRAAEECGRILMVGHLLEYHPVFLELERRVAAGEVGELRRLYSNRLSWGLLRTEENVLWSFAPHDLSMILRLVGKEPERVMCVGQSWILPGIEDAVTVSLDFGEGFGAHVFVSWQHPFKEQRLVVNGEQGVLVFEDSAPAERKLMRYHHSVDFSNPRPVAKKGEEEPLSFPKTEPLRDECQAFLTAVATRTPPPTDGPSALRVLRVLEAAQTSLDSGGEWAELAD